MKNKRSIHEVAFRLSYDMSLQITARLGEIGADLPPQQIRTLRLIWSGKDVTLVDIANTLKRDKAQVVRIIDQLSKVGMVKREPNPKDGRSKILKLTPKGRTFFERIENIEAQFSQALINDISTKDLNTFFEISDRLSENLKNIEIPDSQ